MAKYLIRNMPAWLYEPLPYLYAAMGVVSIAMLDQLVGKISGLMLIGAGITIWHLRFTYRSRRRRPEQMDLSWGHHQSMNPPKNLDKVVLPKKEPEKKVDDPDDF